MCFGHAKVEMSVGYATGDVEQGVKYMKLGLGERSTLRWTFESDEHVGG